MMKTKVQAMALQPGDKVGSGEVVLQVWNAGINIPAGKCQVLLHKHKTRLVIWGKYTMIGIEREETK